MKKLGIILVIVGMGIFVLFGGVAFLGFLLAANVPLFIKIPFFLVVVGIVLLIIAAVKENWWKKDKYKEVEK